MVGVEHEVEHVGHVAIEAHTGLDIGHFLHTAHVFTLRDHDRSGAFAHNLCHNVEFSLVHLGQLALEHS